MPIEIWWLDTPCGLDVPFNARHGCTGTLTGMDDFVDGRYDTSHVAGTDMVATAALKLFDSLGGRWPVVADMRLVGRVVEGGSPVTTLVYAYVAGATYGEAAVPTASEQGPERPSRLMITSVYPNPFSSTATVSYQVQEPGRVTVEVFDVLGRHVATLLDGSEAAGPHEVTFDATKLPSGTYVYRLEATGQVRTGTMLLLK